MRRAVPARFLLACGVVAGAMLLLPGCGVGCIPVPVSRDIARVEGTTQAVPDLSRVSVGSTTRRELEELLAPFVTSASTETFLWARWEQVSTPIGCYRGTETDRDWERMNVLALSDSSGVLTRFRRCSEGDLLKCLVSMAQDAPPAPPDTIRWHFSHDGFWATSPNTYFDGLLDRDGLFLQNDWQPKGWQQLDPARRIAVLPGDIEEVSIRNSGYPAAVDVKIRFKRGFLPVTDLTSYMASPRDVWGLIQYLRTAKPSLFAPQP